MKIISKQECEEWLVSNLSSRLTLPAVETEYPRWINYQLPIDTGRKTALARAVSCMIHGRRPGLFWITAWGVFQSCELPAIFYGYRKSLGEDRQLIDAPGHIFSDADLRELESLVGLSLYFYWDASLFDGSGNTVVKWDHHEWMSIYAKDNERLQEVIEMLKPYDLKEVAAG